MKRLRKALALVLATILTVGAIPTTVLAGEDPIVVIDVEESPVISPLGFSIVDVTYEAYSFEINKATDNNTLQDELKYGSKIYAGSMSLDDLNIQIELDLDNEVIEYSITEYMIGEEHTVSNTEVFTGSTTGDYWLAVFVEDADGNQSTYGAVKLVRPIEMVISNPEILISDSTANKVVLNVKGAYPETGLTYRFIYSTNSGYIDTVENFCDHNFWQINDFYNEETNTFNIEVTNLMPDTEYFFNILVIDTYGNKLLYNLASEKTDYRSEESYFGFEPETGTILSYDANGPKDIVVPEKIDGVLVTKIGDYAFLDKDVTSIFLPNSVTSIGIDAFNTDDKYFYVYIGGNVIIAESTENSATATFKAFYDNGGEAKAGKYKYDNYGFGERWEKAELHQVNLIKDVGSQMPPIEMFTWSYLPEVIVEDGYIFDGWFEDPDFDERSEFDESDYVERDITLYAKYYKKLIGEGTEESPYLIESAHNLLWMSKLIKENNNYENKHFLVTNDINLSGIQWMPIGSKGGTFKGIFDGNGKKVTNLTIGTIAEPSTEYGCVGLFGEVDGAIIKNIDLTINMNLNGGVSAEDRNFISAVGGLLAIDGLYEEGSSIIENCTVSGKITIWNDSGEYIGVGGLAGIVGATNIFNSKSNVSIIAYNKEGNTTRKDWMFDGYGGFIGGAMESIISNCSSEGDINVTSYSKYIGGFIGYNSANITNCSATGNVSAENSGSIGGFVGFSERHMGIVNSYATGDVIGNISSFVGGFAGETGSVIINSYAAGHLTGGEENELVNGYTGGFAGVVGIDSILMYTYNNGNITDIAVGYINEGAGGQDSNNSVVTEMDMKKAIGQPGAFVDILNANALTANEAGAEEWAISPRANKGFPIFKKDMPPPIVPTSSRSNKKSGQNDVQVVINGIVQKTGTETIKRVDGKTEVKLVVDSEQMNKRIDSEMKNNSIGSNEVTIPIVNKGDSVKVLLTGELIKKLEDNNFKLSVKEDSIEYNLDAKEFAINKVATSMGIDSDNLKSIEIEISITKIDSKEATEMMSKAKEMGHTIVFEPVSFEITARTTSTSGKVEEVKLSKFDNYVERIMEIPSDVDPSKVTTGVVFNEDGTYNHVPTEVFEKDGKWYARINSLTNSTYSVISNQVSVNSVKGHWSEEAVNDMASRLVLVGYENFEANKSVTRAEFADYIVRALGLYREGLDIENKFTDLKENKNLMSVLIASDRGIVNGYMDGTFRPEATITREEAMTMYARAMDIVRIIETNENKLSTFSDQELVANWATSYVQKVVNCNIFNGKGNDILDPKGTLTHAESLSAIRNLLIRAELIDSPYF
ncbi:MAG: hypothetical protein CVV02_07725 [Firmicutes bacterium HGW-Firmicutes-7]|nr:MAG: hypothetical protein CVV02_07725 [Firmicutes bacterium HGW-Firmicutes-7]